MLTKMLLWELLVLSFTTIVLTAAAAAAPEPITKVSAATKDAVAHVNATDLRALAEAADAAQREAQPLADAFNKADAKVRQTARTAPGYDAALQARFAAKVPYEAAAIKFEAARKAFEDARAAAQAADAALDAELCKVVTRTPEIDAFCARRAPPAEKKP